MLTHDQASHLYERLNVRLLHAFPELVTQLGGDPAALLCQAGLEPKGSDDGGPGATYRQTVELLEMAAAELRCPDFGMRLAMLQGGSMAGPLGEAMRKSRSFGDALDYVANHSFAHSLAARIWIKRLPGSDGPLAGGVFAGHDILLDRLPRRSQAMEMILLSGHLSASEITGGKARVRRVHFRHEPVSPLPRYRHFFGCEVRFGQGEDGVFYAARDLACPAVEHDAVAYARVTAEIDRRFARQRPPMHALARGAIMQHLGSGQCSNDRVAAELGLHPRTLHRRLLEEGTSFQRIKDEVRRDVMLYFLEQTGLDFARISEKLGFAEQSVMTRSCNRWFGTSPTRLRAGLPQ